ncbi:MAG: sigma 54-interacting transcriptional regulator [Desulfovibrionales bacterium]
MVLFPFDSDILSKSSDIFDLQCDLICCFDQQGRITFLNHALSSFIGRRKHEVIGETIFRFLPPEEHENVSLALSSLNRESPLTSLEAELADQSGRIRSIHWVARAIHEPDGSLRYLAIGRDGTDELTLERNLAQSNQRLKIALEVTAVGIFDWHLPTENFYINSEWMEYMGCPKDPVTCRVEDWVALVHPEDRDRFQRTLGNIRSQKQQAFEFEGRFRTGSGEYKWVLTRGMVTKQDERGRVVQVTGTTIDITEKKRAEEQLRRQDEFLRNVLDSMGAQVAVLDSHGVIRNVNESWRRISQDYGDSNAKDWIGESYLEACDLARGKGAEGAHAVGDGIRKILAEEQNSFSMEYPCHSPGVERWLMVQVTPLTFSGRVAGAVVAHFNITDRILGERARREKNELHNQLFANNHSVMLLLDPDTLEIVEANRAASEFYGYSPEDLKGKRITEINLLSESAIKRNMNIALKEGRTKFHYRHRLASGEIRDVEVYSGPMAILGKTLLCAIVHDITEQKQMEANFLEAFKIKEEYRVKLEAVFSSIPDPIITIDSTLQVISANEAAERLFAGPESTLSGKMMQEIFPSTFCPVRSILEETVRLKKPVKERKVHCDPRKHEHCSNTKENLQLVLNCTPLQHEGSSPKGAVLLIRDVTKQAELERAMLKRHSFGNIIGKSAVMRELYAVLERMAGLETTVLVTGESGTGKELIAEALHYEGTRAKGPLIRVNCSALSEQILESELFGHVRGAFTGAVKDRVGRFQAASGGTIFLDEIGDITPSLQVKLLRFLESKEFERVGDSRTIKSDARIIAATNADLRAKVSRGEFRQDLYYRLKVMHLHIPPLWKRREDIPLLVDHFLSRFRESMQTGVTGLSMEVMDLFLRHEWPGNVRELKHTLEHACILCTSGEIQPRHLPAEIEQCTRESEKQPLTETGLTREALVQGLQKAGNNKAKAARELGIGRATLYRKIREFGIIP